MTFEKCVKKLMGRRKFKKLTPSEKCDIKQLSSFQTKTRNVYRNGFLKVYEDLGIA